MSAAMHTAVKPTYCDAGCDWAIYQVKDSVVTTAQLD